MKRSPQAHIALPGAPVAALVESLLYGAHVVLFCICAYILVKRRSRRQLVLLFAATAMVSVATADIYMTFSMVLSNPPSTPHDIEQFFDAVLKRLYPKNPLYVTNNFLADALLLYRCYMVWGERPYVIVGPVVLLVADTVWGYISIGTTIYSLECIFSSLFLWSVLVFNLVMTAVTAGRIWWIARAARRLLGKQTRQRYRTAVAIIIESGVIYCISLLLMLVMPPKSYKLIFQAIAIRLVAIMPTLMIVQVELGRHGGRSCQDAEPSLRSSNPGVYFISNINVPSDDAHLGDLICPEKIRDLEVQESR